MLGIGVRAKDLRRDEEHHQLAVPARQVAPRAHAVDEFPRTPLSRNS
jgi:hypothetical protein